MIEPGNPLTAFGTIGFQGPAAFLWNVALVDWIFVNLSLHVSTGASVRSDTEIKFVAFSIQLGARASGQGGDSVANNIGSPHHGTCCRVRTRVFMNVTLGEPDGRQRPLLPCY